MTVSMFEKVYPQHYGCFVYDRSAQDSAIVFVKFQSTNWWKLFNRKHNNGLVNPWKPMSTH